MRRPSAHELRAASWTRQVAAVAPVSQPLGAAAPADQYEPVAPAASSRMRPEGTGAYWPAVVATGALEAAADAAFGATSADAAGAALAALRFPTEVRAVSTTDPWKKTP